MEAIDLFIRGIDPCAFMNCWEAQVRVLVLVHYVYKEIFRPPGIPELLGGQSDPGCEFCISCTRQSKVTRMHLQPRTNQVVLLVRTT